MISENYKNAIMTECKKKRKKYKAGNRIGKIVLVSIMVSFLTVAFVIPMPMKIPMGIVGILCFLLLFRSNGDLEEIKLINNLVDSLEQHNYRLCEVKVCGRDKELIRQSNSEDDFHEYQPVLIVDMNGVECKIRTNEKVYRAVNIGKYVNCLVLNEEAEYYHKNFEKISRDYILNVFPFVEGMPFYPELILVSFP